MARHSTTETKSISICQLDKREEEFKDKYIVGRRQKNKKYAEVQERAQGTEGEELDILSHEDGEIGNREQIRSTSIRTVMICDDERDILMSFAIGLQAKYNVLTAKSGEECIKQYLDAKRSGRKIDLILLDYRLGDITSLEQYQMLSAEEFN